MTGSISENVGNRATVAAIIIAMAAVRKCLRRNEREPNCLLFNDVIYVYFEKKSRFPLTSCSAIATHRSRPAVQATVFCLVFAFGCVVFREPPSVLKECIVLTERKRVSEYHTLNSIPLLFIFYISYPALELATCLLCVQMLLHCLTMLYDSDFV